MIPIQGSTYSTWEGMFFASPFTFLSLRDWFNFFVSSDKRGFLFNTVKMPPLPSRKCQKERPRSSGVSVCR